MKEHQVTDNPDVSIPGADGKPAKRIPLTKGWFALVDADDYDFLSQWRWCVSAAGRRGAAYAYRNQHMPGGKMIGVFMHRVILETPPGMVSDHIDGDGLNNTRGNLRVVTPRQNQMNRRPNRGGTSPFKGVCLDTSNPRKPWLARIGVNGRRIFLGRFTREDDAGAAYAGAAVKYFGGYARVSD